jgi:hypothetical protein
MTGVVLLVLLVADGEPGAALEPVTPPKAPSPLIIDASVGGGVTQQPTGQFEPFVQVTLGLQRGWARLQLSPMYVFGRRIDSGEGGASSTGGFREVYLGAIGGRLDTVASLVLEPFLRVEAGASLTMLVVLNGLQNLVLMAPAVLVRAPINLGAFRFGLEGGVGVNLTSLERGLFQVISVPRFFGTVGAFVGHTIP